MSIHSSNIDHDLGLLQLSNFFQEDFMRSDDAVFEIMFAYHQRPVEFGSYHFHNTIYIFRTHLNTMRFIEILIISVVIRGLRSWIPFPKKAWEISRPEHSGTSFSLSRLSNGIQDWLLPGLFQVGKHLGIPERFLNKNKYF